ncbi:MAG: phycobilisome linker polypeptide [Geitlerinemataceae cyanobacterium]
MAFQYSAQLGLTPFEDATPSELWMTRSDEEIDNIVRAVYKQVLGNTYVMKRERLTSEESKLKDGRYTVRDFVRAVAKSELYRDRFFDSCDPLRFTEVNYKHLLGRAPKDYDEIKLHSDILEARGFEADIDWYVDSDEYTETFGNDTVPFLRGYKTEATANLVSYTNFFQLQRGPASSDFGNTRARLTRQIVRSSPASVVPPSGGSSGWSFQSSATDAKGAVTAMGNSKMYRIETTGYRAKKLNRIPKYRRSNKVYLVPFDKLSEEYQRIHRQGGVIASITPVG